MSGFWKRSALTPCTGYPSSLLSKQIVSKKIHKNTRREIQASTCRVAPCIPKAANCTIAQERRAAVSMPFKLQTRGPSKFLFMKTVLASLSCRCLFTFASQPGVSSLVLTDTSFRMLMVEPELLPLSPRQTRTRTGNSATSEARAALPQLNALPSSRTPPLCGFLARPTSQLPFYPACLPHTETAVKSVCQVN